MRATSQTILKDCKEILSELNEHNDGSETDEVMSAGSERESDIDFIDDEAEPSAGTWRNKVRSEDDEGDESEQELDKRVKALRKKSQVSHNKNAGVRTKQDFSKVDKDIRRERESEMESEREDDSEYKDDARKNRKPRKEEAPNNGLGDALGDDLASTNGENEITDTDINELEKEGGFIPIAKKKVVDVSGAITARKIFFSSATR